MRRSPLEQGKYYHVFNRSIDRRIIFSSQEDYDRFEAYLYLLNDTESDRAANHFSETRRNHIFTSGRGERYVAIGAYSLTQYGFDLLVTPVADNGGAKFMQKLLTAYTMYYNKKYNRAGSIFQGTYRSIECLDNDHLKYVFTHTHLTPAALFDSRWHNTLNAGSYGLAKRALQYRYSSFGEYVSKQFRITDPTLYPKKFARTTDPHQYLNAWLRHHKRNSR